MIFPLRRRKIVETRKNKMMIDTQVNFYLYFHTQKKKIANIIILRSG